MTRRMIRALLTEILRAARRYAPRVPVIIMTGYPSIEDAAALATLDVSEYVSKPFDLDAIQEEHRGRGDAEPD